jgi:hypothetical protein
MPNAEDRRARIMLMALIQGFPSGTNAPTNYGPGEVAEKKWAIFASASVFDSRSEEAIDCCPCTDIS